ncbi:GntR family transcriptional regulator [Streptomyces canus]|uniref:GntR family transcriptional regulator n=1 Tax=Streptomyces canus TaxID=58343 RepID=UPI00340FF756
MSADVTTSGRLPSRTRGPDPLWSQAADLILENIERKNLAAGTRLASERDLSTEFGISRVTLRRALNHLVERGVVTASHGRGWFIASSVAAYEWPNDLESFTATARRKHMTTRSLVLRQESKPASLDEAERLHIAAGTPLLHLERVRLLNDVRIAVDHSALPLSTAPDLEDLDFTEASLFDALQSRGVTLARSIATIEACSADEMVSARLGIGHGAPILLLDQVLLAPHQRPVLVSRVQYSGERYRLRTTLQPR